ncbi:mCG147737 [Mus musculus]|nr:mCG147737 [Mus musculus]
MRKRLLLLRFLLLLLSIFDFSPGENGTAIDLIKKRMPKKREMPWMLKPGLYTLSPEPGPKMSQLFPMALGILSMVRWLAPMEQRSVLCKQAGRHGTGSRKVGRSQATGLPSVLPAQQSHTSATSSLVNYHPFLTLSWDGGCLLNPPCVCQTCHQSQIT